MTDDNLGWFSFKVGLIALFAIATLTAAGFGVRWIIAGPEGATQAREQTIGSGSFRIAAYNHFFDLCSEIQGMEGQIAALESEEPGSEERREQVRASITALKAQRSRSIARYNTDASKEYTIGQFRSVNLPFRLNTQEETVCA